MSEILMTKEGLEAKKEELRRLKEEERPALRAQLQEARAQGDLSENADYDAAKKAQGELESKIAELEVIIANAKIIQTGEKQVSDASKLTVKVGCTVKLLNLNTNVISEYRIVGTKEANPAEGKISNECALAVAIEKHKIGDERVVHCNKPYTVRILDIKN